MLVLLIGVVCDVCVCAQTWGGKENGFGLAECCRHKDLKVRVWRGREGEGGREREGGRGRVGEERERGPHVVCQL